MSVTRTGGGVIGAGAGDGLVLIFNVESSLSSTTGRVTAFSGVVEGT